MANALTGCKKDAPFLLFSLVLLQSIGRAPNQHFQSNVPEGWQSKA
jgi:hypothetical protein